MPKSFTPVSAGTSFPNTPESDMRPTVACDVDVKLADGSTEVVRLFASDPGEALDKVRGMSEETFKALARVAPK